jgi:hypothetical protein
MKDSAKGTEMDGDREKKRIEDRRERIRREKEIRQLEF